MPSAPSTWLSRPPSTSARRSSTARCGDSIAAVSFVQVPSPHSPRSHQLASASKKQSLGQAAVQQPLAGRNHGRRGSRGRLSALCPPRPRTQGETSGATCCGSRPGRRLPRWHGGTASGTHLAKSKLAWPPGRRLLGPADAFALNGARELRRGFGVLDGRRALADEPERRRAAFPRQPADEDEPDADRGPRPIWAARA